MDSKNEITEEQGAQKRGRARARKTILKPRTAHQEIIFERVVVQERRVEPTADKKPSTKGKAIPPEILQRVKDEFDKEIFENAEMQDVITKIAKERIQINYALQKFGMPEIDFRLGQSKEEMMLMFSDRLYERNMQNRKE